MFGGGAPATRDMTWQKDRQERGSLPYVPQFHRNGMNLL